MSGETPTSEIHKVEWSLKNSAFNSPKGSNYFINSKFRTSPESNVSWELRLYPRGDGNTEMEYVGLFVGGGGWKMNDLIRVKHRLGFIARDGREKNTRVYCDTMFINNESKAKWMWWGNWKFILRDMLLDSTQKFFRGDQLIIFCDVEVYWNLEVPERRLSYDFREMLESGEFSDVVLVVGEEEIKAHKVVLCARSSVFAAMFKYNMAENQTGRVLIEDLDIVGVRALLRFIYSEEVSDLKAIAEKVLPAADKYGVDRLKVLCEEEICKKVTIQNVVEMLSLAELHNASQLKARALSFIIYNATKVAEQDCYLDLADSNPDLMREIYSFSIESREQNSRRSQEQVNRKKLTMNRDWARSQIG